MKNVFLVAVALACVACGGAEDSSVIDQQDEAAGELRTAGIKSIAVTRSAGFGPPMRPCRPSGNWEFDFESRKLTGSACLGAVAGPIDKTVSEDDATRIRKAVSGVRVTQKPTACPTDIPVSTLRVKRAQSEAVYRDARATCVGTEATPVKEDGLGELVELLQDLSARSPQPLPGSLFEGKLVRPTSSTYGLETDDETFNLTLDESEAAEFVSGRRARVTGSTLVAGMASRKTIRVSEILVCPASGRTIDCMPPIRSDATAKLCENSEWIVANCGTVQFAH